MEIGTKTLEKFFKEAPTKSTWQGGREDEKYMSEQASKMGVNAEIAMDEADKKFDKANEDEQKLKEVKEKLAMD